MISAICRYLPRKTEEGGMRIILPVLLSMALFVLSCAHQREAVKLFFKKDARVEDRKKDKDAAGAKKNRDDAMRKRIEALVLEKDYERAVELIGGAVRSGKPEPFYGRQYVMAINGLAGEGMYHYYMRDYEPAGMLFRKVVDNYPSDGHLRARVRFSMEETLEHLETCSGKLVEEGLLEYRRGNLGNAISKWKKVLRFNPGYGNVKKMIDTATTQMKKLETF
jgi:tetratricopeptide (TPR) repeat protein